MYIFWQFPSVLVSNLINGLLRMYFILIEKLEESQARAAQKLLHLIVLGGNRFKLSGNNV